jgi:palmitoyltransferase|tara:strand:+ start:11037 stop:12053 length:1017 start_codon:yes stop_codon:yes gene_type:complete
MPRRESSRDARLRRARVAFAPSRVVVVVVIAALTLLRHARRVDAGGFGRSSLYSELQRTYGLGGREADAEHDVVPDPNAREAEPEPEEEKPANLLHVGHRMDHEELRNQFEKFPDHHDINAPLHRSGLTALKHAILVGNDTYVRTVIELGADTNAKLYGGKAIHFNAGSCGQRGSVPILHALLEHGADPIEETDQGYQPIHIAARGWKKYCIPYMQTLLEAEAVDPNARRSTGNLTTPLHEAAHKSSFEMVKVLIDAGADVNAQDADGETPLHKAIRGDHIHAAWGLMSNGADIFIKNKRGIDVEALANLMRADYDTKQMFKQHKESLEKKKAVKDEL